MLQVLGILALLALVAVSIGLHEIGHLVPAKRFGVKVPEYAIGFGPVLFSRQVGETTYRIRLLPVGGFIRMIGMYAPVRADGRRVGGPLARMIEEARETSAEEIGPGDDSRAFYRLAVPKRLVIMMGGPLMNLLLAAVMFAIIFSGIGISQPTNRVGTVVDCVPTSSDPAGKGTVAGCGAAGITPAKRAGLQSGDTIIAVNRKPVTQWQEFISANPDPQAGQVISLTVRRVDGTVKELADITLADYSYAVIGADGKPTGETKHRGFIGVTPAWTHVKQPLSVVPTAMWSMTQQAVSSLVHFPVMVYEVAQSLFGSTPRSATGPISVVGVTMISGDIAASDLSITDKFQEILGLAASLNLFLFLFNLVPLLPLDGGHAAGAIFEAVRRQWARLRRRSDPGPIDLARALPLTYAMSVVLLVSGLIVILADIFKPIALPL